LRETPLILIVDDNAANLDILEARLTSRGYATANAVNGTAALERVRALRPDLVLLDIMMPEIDGIEVCRRIKADPDLPFIPVILVTAKADSKDVVAGLDAGADDYLTKPIDQQNLMARVRAMLRIKALQDTVKDQACRLEAQAGELARWNRTLEQKVSEQIGEIERVSRLKRFLPAQIAELVVSSGQEQKLDSHRREISVVFSDLRGFTTFAEVAEPEEVIEVLRAYHAAAGRLIDKYEGTLERFLGDGLMVLFNDPLPCPDPAARAVKLGAELRDEVGQLAREWFKRGHELGLGIGVAHGFATLGKIGFEGRHDYTAIGTVVNQAARLCAEAKAGEILISRRVQSLAEALIECEALGELTLKGLRQPVSAYRLLNLRQTLAEPQQA
jgi:class 3 adenylate cyclase/AmiR/NasT family two-component response regulator